MSSDYPPTIVSHETLSTEEAFDTTEHRPASEENAAPARIVIIGEGVSEAEARVLLDSYHPEKVASPAEHARIINPFDVLKGFFVDTAGKDRLL